LPGLRLVAAPAYALALRWYLRRSMPYYARERVATGERTQAKAGAPKYTRSEGLAEYGARVLDYLLGLGAPPTEVYAASTTAVMMVLESVPGQPEHEQALGNSGAPSGG
jgi:hypothetical protein